MTTVRMSGDFGDCVLGMPVMRYYGPCIFYGEAANYTRQRLTWDKWQPIVPLLKAQPYIADVAEWTGQSVTITLNDFRAAMFKALRDPNSPLKSKSLTDWMLDTHQVPLTEKDRAWLTVEPKREAAVVFNRSSRYHNPLFPWKSVVERYGKDAVFVGFPEEHHTFCIQFGKVRHYPTKDLLEVAQVINGADLFVGNQSCPHAIAEGLKKNIILECWSGGMNTLFFREGVIHGINQGLYRPILS